MIATPVNPFCMIDPLSPFCVNPVGVVQYAQILQLRINWLNNELVNPSSKQGGYIGLVQYSLALLLKEQAELNGTNNCTPPRPTKKCPCLQPGAVFDVNGSLELQTLNRQLINNAGITQGIFIQPCLLYFFTPAIIYSITFGRNGAKFQIKRLYKSEGTWVLVALSAYLMEVVGTLQLFKPFLNENQIDEFWSGVRIPQA